MRFFKIENKVILQKKFKQKIYTNPLENVFKNGKQTLVFQQKS